MQIQVEPTTIQKWLTEVPLNGTAQWRKGPVKEGVLRGEGTAIPAEVLDSRDIHYALNSPRVGERTLTRVRTREVLRLSYFCGKLNRRRASKPRAPRERCA